MAEVISTYIPPSFYEAYYLYLYIGSMFFLFYMYMVLLRDKRRIKKKDKELATISKLLDSFIGGCYDKSFITKWRIFFPDSWDCLRDN